MTMASSASDVPPMTVRGRAKADRRAAIVRAATELFAQRGYGGVSLEEIGAAVEVSGPAVYRHFAGKQALLGAILVEVSRRLLDGAEAVLTAEPDPSRRLDALVAFHVDFALRDADVIRVQDRDLVSLTTHDRHEVRRLQREYVEHWVAVLGDLRPEAPAVELRVRAHAVFGLINSTPYSVRTLRPIPSDVIVRRTLESMALAAFSA